MGYAVTAIVHRAGELDHRAVLDALAEFADQSPVPHPHPREEFRRVRVDADTLAVRYTVGGYPTRSEAHGYECEFMLVDGFLDVLAEHARRYADRFRFHGFMSEDIGGDSAVCRHTEAGFELRQVFADGTAQRVWTDADGEVRQVSGDVSVDPTPFERDGDLADEEGYLAAREDREAPFSPAGLLYDDLGVSAARVIDALVRADGRGDVLWAYP